MTVEDGRWSPRLRRRRAAYDNIIILTWGLGVLPPSSLCVQFITSIGFLLSLPSQGFHPTVVSNHPNYTSNYYRERERFNSFMAAMMLHKQRQFISFAIQIFCTRYLIKIYCTYFVTVEIRYYKFQNLNISIVIPHIPIFVNISGCNFLLLESYLSISIRCILKCDLRLTASKRILEEKREKKIFVDPHCYGKFSQGPYCRSSGFEINLSTLGT